MVQNKQQYLTFFICTGNGNNNEKFFIDWYNKLQKIFLHFLRDAITFCKKRMTNLSAELQKTETKLRQKSRT